MENVVNKGTGTEYQIIKMMKAIDAGSTETRVMTFSNENKSIFVTPAEYGVLFSNIEHIDSVSKNFEDNLEIELCDITPGKEKMFERLNIVKGSLMRQSNCMPEILNSTNQKRNQVQYYVNIVLGIALSIVNRRQGAIETGMLFDIDTTIAIPPEDNDNIKKINDVKEKLQGRYTINFSRLGISFTIQIKRESILIEDESKAVLRCYGVERKGQLTGKRIVFDIGGRSTDMALIDNDILIASYSKTFRIGGVKIAQILKEQIMSDPDLDLEVSLNMAESAMLTGIVKDGAKDIDVKKHISKARQLFMIEVFKEYNAILSYNNCKPNEIYEIVLVGRPNTLMEGTVSLSKILEMLNKKDSPNTLIGRVNKEYPIIHGLYYYRLSKM